MTRANLDALFRPASIAIVGASGRSDAAGSRVMRNLRQFGYGGRIYPVNPRYDEIAGLRCYPSLTAIPDPVDAVFLGIPAEGGPDILAEAAARGVRAAVINASGYGDSDAAGQERQERLCRIAQEGNIALCGPNNTGIINLVDGVAFSTFPVLPKLTVGRVAVIAQSGSIALALAQDDRNLGLSHVVTCGNEAVCTVSDYLDHLAGDDRVDVILIFLETLRDPAGFARAALKARQLGKPVLAVKIGRSAAGAAVAAAHTNAIAGDDRLYDAFFRGLGVIRVADLDELLETAVLFARNPRGPRTANVVPVTMSGGEAALIADLGAGFDLPMHPLSEASRTGLREVFPPFGKPGNPLDAWGLGWTPERFATIAGTLASDPGVGVVAIAVDAPASEGADAEISARMAEICGNVADRDGTEFVFVSNVAAGGISPALEAAASAHGIPCLCGMRAGFGAIAHWVRRGGLGEMPARAADQPDGPAAAPLTGLTEPQVFARLAAAGLPMVDSHRADSAEAAVKAAQAIGFPVVMKGTAPSLPHKSELGLVKVGLADAAAVRDAFATLQATLSAHAGDDPMACVVVQAMSPPGIELILGLRNEPGFGSFVVVGPGGTMVELLAQSSIRLGPVDADEARAMLAETAALTLLRGHRGAPPADIDAAVNAIVALSQLGASLGSTVSAIEVNPLIVHASGAFGVDALCVAATPG